MTKPAGLTPPTYSLCSNDSSGSALRVDFRRSGDRFMQSIHWLSSDGECLGGWVAVQRSEPEHWPASPPIQELSLESIQGREVLLGVGRAGKCHWSVSVETTQIADVAALRFDIACRCPESPQWLGSTYQIESNESANPTAAAVADLRIRCEDDARLIREQSGRFRVEPLALQTNLQSKWPATIRWRYALLSSTTAR